MTTAMIFDYVAIKAALEEKRKSEPPTDALGWVYLPDENRWLYTAGDPDVAYTAVRYRLVKEYAEAVRVGVMRIGEAPEYAVPLIRAYLSAVPNRPPEALSGENAD